MEELYDLVDKNDKVIGDTNKNESHSRGFIHRIVCIFVFTLDGKLYIQDHKKSLMWDNSVGGHVKKGESYEEAVEREGTEELGLKGPYSKVSQFFSDETYRGKAINHFISLYECEPKDWIFHPNEEVQTIEALSIPELITWMNNEPKKFTPGLMNNMAEYIKVKSLPYKLLVR